MSCCHTIFLNTILLLFLLLLQLSPIGIPLALLSLFHVRYPYVIHTRILLHTSIWICYSPVCSDNIWTCISSFLLRIHPAKYVTSYILWGYWNVQYHLASMSLPWPEPANITLCDAPYIPSVGYLFIYSFTFSFRFCFGQSMPHHLDTLVFKSDIYITETWLLFSFRRYPNHCSRFLREDSVHRFDVRLVNSCVVVAISRYRVFRLAHLIISISADILSLLLILLHINDTSYWCVFLNY